MNSNNVTCHTIRYGRDTIAFDLEYSQRKTLEISVYPDLSVRVKAPIEASISEIITKIQKRALWIIEQKHFFSLYLPKQLPKRYVNGESYAYLGKQYRLKVIVSNKERVLLKRGMLLVYVKTKNNTERIKQLLEGWYKEQAKKKFKQRLALCGKKLEKYGITTPNISIRKMSKRWGSCSKHGKVILNVQLIKAPSHCIDYVIMHELCHLKYYNHSKAFYKLLNLVLPDWQLRKKRLEQVQI